MRSQLQPGGGGGVSVAHQNRKLPARTVNTGGSDEVVVDSLIEEQRRGQEGFSSAGD